MPDSPLMLRTPVVSAGSYGTSYKMVRLKGQRDEAWRIWGSGFVLMQICVDEEG